MITPQASLSLKTINAAVVSQDHLAWQDFMAKAASILKADLSRHFLSLKNEKTINFS